MSRRVQEGFHRDAGYRNNRQPRSGPEQTSIQSNIAGDMNGASSRVERSPPHHNNHGNSYRGRGGRGYRHGHNNDEQSHHGHHEGRFSSGSRVTDQHTGKTDRRPGPVREPRQSNQHVAVESGHHRPRSNGADGRHFQHRNYDRQEARAHPHPHESHTSKHSRHSWTAEPSQDDRFNDFPSHVDRVLVDDHRPNERADDADAWQAGDTSRDWTQHQQNEPWEDEQGLADRPQPYSNYVVRLRGFPFSADENDLAKFLQGSNICPQGVHMVVDDDGRSAGEAFVELMYVEDVDLALQKHRQHMGARYVEVFRIYPEDLAAMLDD